MRLKLFKRIMEILKCDHTYEYIRAYRRESYYDDRYGTVVHPLGFHVRCTECGLKRDVSEAWCKSHRVKDMPKVHTKRVKRR